MRANKCVVSNTTRSTASGYTKSLLRFAWPAAFRESRAIIKCLAVVPAAGCVNSATSLWRSPINGL
jgi:hypothetical protein